VISLIKGKAYIYSLFVRLISHQPVVLFSQNKPVTSNQPAVLFSQNKSASATSQINRLTRLQLVNLSNCRTDSSGTIRWRELLGRRLGGGPRRARGSWERASCARQAQEPCRAAYPLTSVLQIGCALMAE
jgi:hypothetical protein